MRRILFLYTPRSGSGFLGNMLKGSLLDSLDPVWLHTEPSNECMFFPGVDIVDIPVQPLFNCEAFDFYAPASCSPDFYNNLPGDDWKFVYLLRDPRNKLESAYKGALKHDSEISYESVFLNEAQVFKTFVNDHFLGMKNDPRFKIFLFEDLIKNPGMVFGQIFSFCGLQADVDFYDNLASSWVQGRSNSSFDDKGNQANSRWSNWDFNKRERFNNLVGAELIQMGFESDNNWIL